jgi:heptosyltransferase-1
VNKFLIVRLGSLGDVIHGIPVAAALRAADPRGQIDWMIDPRYMPLLDLVTCVDRGVPTDPRMFARGGQRSQFFHTLRGLRQTRYDAVIDLQGLLKSAVLSRAVRARRTIGFPRRHLREPLARLFYTDAPDPGGKPHVIFKNLALLAALQIHDQDVRFPIATPRTATVESVLGRFGPDGFMIINPGAAWPNKQWPPERFGRLAAAIHRQFGWRALVLWGPGEQSLAAAVAAASADAAEVSPPTTIIDLFGIARGARLMVSGDTGPLHIAGALGTPIVALFGPTQPERNGPWDAHDVSVSRVKECICLYERRCRRTTPCINDISIEEVLDAIDRRVGTP